MVGKRGFTMVSAVFGCALLPPSMASAANLIANGNFEAGNTGFSSGYTYNPADNANHTEYTIGTSGNAWNSRFTAAGDHTSGTGNMMIVNGSTQASKIVWQSSPITLSAATDYVFEGYAMRMGGGPNVPSLSFTVSLDGGAEFALDTFTLPGRAGVWSGFSTRFNSGAASKVSLFIRDTDTASSGNDFALDDLSLDTSSSVPEPSSWALMMLGFGMVGTTVRRHRKGKTAVSYA